jgi:hypothetical protein
LRRPTGYFEELGGIRETPGADTFESSILPSLSKIEHPDEKFQGPAAWHGRRPALGGE